MTKQELVRDIERLYGRRSFITRKEFAELMGINPKNIGDRLDGLMKVEGKYYFIPDVADRLIQRTMEGER